MTLVLRLLSLLLVGLLVSVSAAEGGQDHYVAPNGSRSGTGAADNPWDFATALSHPPAVGPGDTIWVRSGAYQGQFISRLRGSEGNPIIVRNYPGERVTIEGVGGPDQSALTVYGGSTWFLGLEITSARQGQRPSTRGVVVAGEGTRFINLAVHDTLQAFSIGSQAQHTELYGNVIYGNGSLGLEVHAPGIDVEPGSGRIRIAANLIFHQAGLGIRIADGSDAFVEENTVFDNGVRTGALSGNIRAGAGQVTALKNRTYSPLSLRYGGTRFAELGSACGYIRLEGNYLADGALLPQGECVNHQIRGNSFVGVSSVLNAFRYADNSIASSGASASHSYLVRNNYDASRAYLSVYNWANAPSVNVDVAGFLSPGEVYELRDAGEPFGIPLVRGVYNGGTLEIPVRGEFAAFLLTKAPAERKSEEELGKRFNEGVPTQDLKLWLRADMGIAQAGGTVSQWTDQSATGTNAVQATAGRQPKFLASAFNGQPALEFDGTNDFLTFELPLNGLNGMTMVLVSASTSSTQNGSSNGATNSPIFWNETAAWSAVHLSPYQNVVRFRFGTGQSNNLPSYTRPTSLGTNHSVSVAIKNGGTETLYVNGGPVLTAVGKLTTLQGVRATGNLGRGYNDNTYFAGRIAEVLVYTRALTDAERQSLEGYLLAKYAPTVPVNQAPIVSAGADQTTSLINAASLNGSVSDDGLPGGSPTVTWSKVSGPGTVTFADPNTASTTATFSVTGSYTLRLTASDGVLSSSDDVVVTVNEPAPGSIPQTGLKLWLKADAGLTQASGKVSEWADQSGSGTNAAQSTATGQPAFLPGAFNGKPALEFDGIDDFLTFNLPLNGLTGMTVVLVSASTSSTQDGSWHGTTHSPIFWNETANWSTVNLSPYQNVVRFRFGTGQVDNLPAYSRPSTMWTNHSVTMAIKNGATEAVYVNGGLVFTVGGKLTTLQGVRSTGNIGRGYNDNTFFAGRIAEVLVYTRALTEFERQALDQYLTDKYAPTVPVNQAPVVNAGTDQTVALVDAASLSGTVSDDGLPSGTLTQTWSKVSGPGNVTFANANAAATTASFTVAGTYTLRLTASDGALSSSDDIVVTVNEAPPGSIPQTGLTLWLKADAGVMQAGGKVSQWSDQSGNGTHATQGTVGGQPGFLASAFSGRPALEFDGIDDFLTFTQPVTGLSGMTMVLVSASTSSTQDGSSHGTTHSPIFWNETADWSTVNLSPYQNVVRFRFGTGQANNLPSYTRSASLGTNHSITMAVKNGSTESLYINGGLVQAATGKLTTMQGARSTGNLGRGYNDNTYFAGRIAEVLVYTRALTDAERQVLDQYLLDKYSLTAPVNQAPVVNAGADQTTSVAANLNGTASDDGLPSGTLTTTWSQVSGPGTVTFANANTASTTATFSATGTYTLRLTASDGVLSSSDDVLITVTDPPPGTIPQTGLKLWLKAEAGVTQAGGKVSQWADQSGSGTNAVQGTAAGQPAFLPTSFSGRPALEFDGTDDFLTFNLPVNGLSGMTMVLVSASTSATQDGSWHGATHSPIFWNETANWSTLNLSPYQNIVKFRFGTGQANNVQSFTRPATIGANHSLTIGVKNGGTESLYINGGLVQTASGKLTTLQGVRTTGNLGRGHNDNTYFAGRIAEVLVYNRALTDAERQSLEQNLIDKYGLTLSPTNQAPVASAGSDQTISLAQAVNLAGTVTDDGLPNGTLTVAWSKVSGPGTVTFGNANVASTTATFSTAGTYILRISASDGAIGSTDDVIVTVSPPPPPAVTNVRITSLYSNHATVEWTTDQLGDSQVVYGTSTAYGSSTAINSTLVTNHAVSLGGLVPNTLYHFSARSKNVEGNVGASPDFTFTTPSTPTLTTTGLVAHYVFSQAADRPAGINELEYAEDMEKWIIWRGNSAVVTPNVAIAPNGTMTADRVWLRSPDGLLYHKYLTAVPGQTYTFSLYMRTESGTFPLRITRDNTICWCGTTSPTLTVTTQWQRFTLTYTVPSGETGTAVGFGYEEITPWNLPAAGEVLVWGAQVEPGSVATPYHSGVRDQHVLDLSGRNNNGWLGSTANHVYDANDPIRKTAVLSWEGSPRWVQAPASTDLDLRTEGTWMALVKPDAGWTSSATILSRAAGTGSFTQYALMRHGTTSEFSFYTGNDSHPYRGGNVPTGVWSALTVTLSGGTLVGYIDATEVFRHSSVPPLNSVPADLRIGVFGPSQNAYRGDMRAVLIYSRALAPQEIAANAAALKGSSTPGAPAPQISAVNATPSSTGATITWSTDQLADSQVEFGNTTSFGQATPINSAEVMAHSVTIAGLSTGTTYHFRVKSRNASWTIATSGTFTFTTLAAPNIPTAGQKLWLRADEGVTQISGAVAQWVDQSGSGTHASQGTAASKPTLVTAAVNGKPALQFDGVNDFLNFTLPLNGLTAMTMVLVSSSTTASDGTTNGVANAPLFWNETAPWGAVHLSPFQSIVKFRFGTQQVNNLPQFSRLSSLGSTFSMTMAIKDGATEKLYVDGKHVLNLNGKLPTISGVSETGNLGRGYNNNTFFAGQIAEVLVYNRALSDAERLQLQQYLANKYYGAQAPLAANNAYSTTQGVALAVSSSDGILANDTDLNGDTLQAVLVSAPSQGVLSLSSTGSFTYTPNPTFSGVDSFTYRARDAALDSNLATVTITVNPVVSGNKAPRIVTGAPAFTKTIAGTGVRETHTVAAADFNGDGRLDLVATDYINGRVLWYENDGSGGFISRVLDASLTGAYPIHVADVDRDGKTDVLAGGYLGNIYVWYKSDGTGGFTRHVIDATALGPHSIVTADLDRDGDIDLLVANQDAGTIGWYENSGTNTFAWRLIDNTATGAKRAEFADLDGDGDLDVVAASFHINEIAWYENNGSGQFFKRVIDTAANGAYYVFPVDVDGDHDQDVLAASQIDGIVLYRNTGFGNFTKHIIDPTASGARTVIAADIDGDGHMDAVAASVNNDTVAWYRNDGSGNFARQVIDSGADGAYGVFTIDIDKDGDIDVLSASRDANAVAVHPQFRAHVTSIQSGGNKIIDTTLLRTVDIDDGSAELTYTITAAPQSGQLEKAGSPMSVGSTFTQLDIDNGTIRYRHSGASAAQDSFSFTVADGGENGVKPGAGTFIINVIP